MSTNSFNIFRGRKITFPTHVMIHVSQLIFIRTVYIHYMKYCKIYALLINIFVNSFFKMAASVYEFLMILLPKT